MADAKKGVESTKRSGPGWTSDNDGAFLTIVVDLSSNLGPSTSGKSIGIAKCDGGQADIGNGITMGLNVYKKLPKQPKK